MAIGRRKVMGRGSSSDALNHVLYTAPAAPVDGSAPATITSILVTNVTGAPTVLNNVTVAGLWVMASVTLAAFQTVIINASIDMNAGDTLAWQLASGGAHLLASGVEAKDS